MDTAVPLGIVVNELVSNALKHAFPAGEYGGREDKEREDEEREDEEREDEEREDGEGVDGEKEDREREDREIHISLFAPEYSNRENEARTSCKNEGGFQFILIVADNGVGIPENFDFRNTDSLGLQLVNILVEQIEGCIELKRDSGTEFRIMFKKQKK